MRVLLVEDDLFHAKVIEEALQSKYPGLNLDRYRTEKEFRSKYRPEDLFDVLIIDQMLPWTSDSDEDFEPPSDLDGPLRAGSRCYERLSETHKKRSIFWTNLERRAVPQGVEYVRKRDDPELRELINVVKRLVSAK